MGEEKPKIYTLQFWLLSFSSFLFFASFNMIIPELPAYLASMGGEEYIGLIISLFTLTAGFARPFSGKLADRIGRVPVMVIGAFVSFVCGLLYPWVLSIAGFLMLRLVHGFSTGFKPTGTSAYIADIVPHNRRGEALGIMSLFGNFGMALGPAIGSFLASAYSLDIMFYASSLFAIGSILILAGMKETLPNRERFKPSLLIVGKNDFFEPKVFKPAITLLFSTFSFGVVLTIIPDYSNHIGLANKGWFFTVFTLSSMAVRFSAGRASDRMGRTPVAMLGMLLMTLSMLMITFIPTPVGLLSAAVFFGFSTGLNAPTIFAWAIDLSDPRHVGRAMATVYIALEIGIGAGALITGTLYAGNPDMFPYAFGIGAAFAFAAFVYLWFWGKK